MYCRECGKEIPNGSAFCPYCGRKLSYDRQDEIKEKEELNNPYEDAFSENNYHNVDEKHQFEDDPFKEFDSPKVEESRQVDNPFNTFANLTFIFGLLGLILGSIPLCILSIVFSKKGIKSEIYSAKAQKGKRLAIIGLIVWSILIIFYEILIIQGYISFSGIYF